MLMLNLRKARRRADGVQSVVPILRRKARKFGPILEEKALPVKRDWLITGAHASGKSRMLQRLAEVGPGVWKNRPLLLLRAVLPLASWADSPAVQAWATAKGDDWKKLKAHERQERLLAWIADVRAVVLLDDCHRMTGRKADIALRAVRAAGLVVASASAEAAIPITLRLELQRRNPEAIALDSDAPYDFTAVLAYLVSIIALAAGAWPLAAAVGGLHLLGRGARASKQS